MVCRLCVILFIETSLEVPIAFGSLGSKGVSFVFFFFCRSGNNAFSFVQMSALGSQRLSTVRLFPLDVKGLFAGWFGRA